MATPDRLLIVSDLHLGAEDGLNICSSQDALSRFIAYAAAQPGTVELVILGDGLDFLQIKPYLSFTRGAAEAKIKGIIKHNQGVFDALKAFLGDARHTLRWFIGNHDLELLFPEVQARIEAEILPGAHGALEWALDGEHRAYALPTGGAIHLAHGNKGDLWNEVDYGAARASALAGGSDDFVYPPGSRLVAEVLNPLKADGLTHIDLLKPEATVAVPLALAAWPERASEHLRRFLGLGLEVKKLELQRKLWPTLGSGHFGGKGAAAASPATAPAPPETAETLMGAALFEALGLADGAPVREQDLADLNALLMWRAPATTRSSAAPSTFAGAEPAILQRLAMSALKRATSGDASLLVEQLDDRAKMVRKNQTLGASLVVLGHTHLARAASLPAGTYLNTGTWADLMRLPRWLADAEYRYVLVELRQHLREPSKAPWYLRPMRRLTYVDIELPGKHAAYDAALRQWPHDGQVTLAKL